MRRATCQRGHLVYAGTISIHALREESDATSAHRNFFAFISIHALREESDRTVGAGFDFRAISIHALREESDPAGWPYFLTRRVFQSTLSVRRATGSRQPRMRIMFVFQSTLSVRRATGDGPRPVMRLRISIHALREESDVVREWSGRSERVFQSTLSVRRATHSQAYPSWLSTFQSTLSVRRATATGGHARELNLFQSTLSVRRATMVTATSRGNPSFQSTLSVRRATRQDAPTLAAQVISIHALREESDCTDGQHVSHCGTSILRTSSRVAGFEVKTRYSNHSTKK